MTDLTRNLQRWLNSFEETPVTKEVYEFQDAMQEALKKGSFIWEDRERRGRRDGHKTPRRVIWKRTGIYGELNQAYEFD